LHIPLLLRYETKPSEIGPTKASEIAPTEASKIAPTESSKIAPNDASEIAPTEGSEIAPNDASEIGPTEGSEIAPNDASEIGFHSSYLDFSHSTIDSGFLMPFHSIVDIQTESQSDVLQSERYTRPFVATESQTKNQSDVRPFFECNQGHRDYVVGGSQTERKTENQSHVRPFVEWNPRRREYVVGDSQTEGQTESQSDVLLTQECVRPIVESNRRCSDYELMVSGMQSLAFDLQNLQ